MFKTDTQRLEIELHQLGDEAVELNAEIERLAALEDQLEDEAELMRASAATRARRNRLKKLDARIGEVRERLALARDAARKKLRKELLDAHERAGRDFLAKARPAQEALAQLLAAAEALEAEGFRREFAMLATPPAVNAYTPLLAPDLLSAFEAALERQAVAAKPDTIALTIVARPKRAQPTVAEPPKPPGPKAITDSQGPVDLNPRPARPASRPLRRESAAEGEVLFHVYRGGLEHERKGRLGAGDVVAVTSDEAHQLMTRGVGDTVTPDQVAQLDASDAVKGRSTGVTL